VQGERKFKTSHKTEFLIQKSCAAVPEFLLMVVPNKSVSGRRDFLRGLIETVLVIID
jgi:hypothetical protein